MDALDHSPTSPAAAKQRPQSAAEEWCNSLSHGLGFLLAVASLPILLQASAQRAAGTAQQLGLSVFALTAMLLYLASALFHALPAGRAKQLFDKLDRAAIYLFIAGTYTPFAAPALAQDAQAWLLLALVWALALAGAAVTLQARVMHPFWSTGLYVLMGWLVLLAAVPWISQVSALALHLLVAGGAVYTLGAVLFLLSARLRFAHLLWHLFVLAGSGLHGAAMLWQV